MKRPSSYNTKQSKAIISYMASLGGEHFTAGQAAEHLARHGTAVGLTTVYRQLERLVKSGMVRKYITDGAGACYQYTGDENCREHFHMICEACGELLHLQCDMLDKLSLHISNEHAFSINSVKTVFYGRHKDCRAHKPVSGGTECP